MTTKEDLEKLEVELAEILKDVKGIDEIISEHDEKGTLNRNKAIDKIIDIRRKNQAVQAITVTTLSYSNVSLSNASNEALVSELRMQRDVLQADYLKKESDAVAIKGRIRLGI